MQNNAKNKSLQRKCMRAFLLRLPILFPCVLCPVTVVFGGTHVVGVHGIGINIFLKLFYQAEYALIIRDVADVAAGSVTVTAGADDVAGTAHTVKYSLADGNVG